MREIIGWIPCQIHGRGVSELWMAGNSNDEGYNGQECGSRGYVSGKVCKMVANALSREWRVNGRRK